MEERVRRPEVTDLRQLNDLAEREDWGLCADASGRFYSADVAAVRDIWRGKAAGGIPQRSAITAQSFRGHLNLISIHERVAEDAGLRRYRLRLMGETLSRDFGEATGKLYEDFLPPGRVRVWNAMSDVVLALAKPVRFLLRSDELKMIGEILAAPLLGADGQPGFVLSARRFNATWKWPELVETWRQEMAALT